MWASCQRLALERNGSVIRLGIVESPSAQTTPCPVERGDEHLQRYERTLGVFHSPPILSHSIVLSFCASLSPGPRIQILRIVLSAARVAL